MNDLLPGCTGDTQVSGPEIEVLEFWPKGREEAMVRYHPHAIIHNRKNIGYRI